MPAPRPSTMKFWIRVLSDGAIRVGGKAIEKALKEGKLTNSDIFFKAGTAIAKIAAYLKGRGVKL